MNKIFLTYFSAFLISNFTYAEVDSAYLQNIYKLIAEKKYQEALEAHQYFFKESKISSGMVGVRTSFALASWAELGSVYPPAFIALSKMASERRALILSGKGTFNIFQEYMAINRYIEEKSETLETFFTADQKYPSQALDYYPSVREMLIAESKYDISKRYENDPIFEYESIRIERERSLSQLRKKVSGYTIESINSEFEVKVKALIELSRKIGMHVEADEIKRRSDSYITGNLSRKYY